LAEPLAKSAADYLNRNGGWSAATGIPGKAFNHKGHEGTQRKKKTKGEADHAPSPLQQAQK
jgi:hypothetical protein